VLARVLVRVLVRVLEVSLDLARPAGRTGSSAVTQQAGRASGEFSSPPELYAAEDLPEGADGGC